MTADKMFDRVLALMFSDSTEKSDLQKSYLATLNIILAETFPNENGIRKSDEKLAAPQIVSALTDELVYHDGVLAFVPYGVAGLLMAEDDPNIATQYKQKYEAERHSCVTARFEDVVNVYGSGL